MSCCYRFLNERQQWPLQCIDFDPALIAATMPAASRYFQRSKVVVFEWQRPQIILHRILLTAIQDALSNAQHWQTHTSVRYDGQDTFTLIPFSRNYPRTPMKAL